MRNLAIAVVLLVGLAVLAFADGNPKTTGDADWVNPNTGQANGTFNAINTTATGPGAKGSLIYTDPKVTYAMDVQWLQVSGNEAWFAGQVTSVTPAGGLGGCCKIGNWIFYKVVDNGEPGAGVDQIWGEDLTRAENIIDSAAALGKVTGQATPSGGPFTINGGNIQVH